MTARVHAHRAADRAGYADGPLEPGEAGGRRASSHDRKQGRGAGGDRRAVDRDVLEGLAQRDGETVEAVIGDEEVRTLADDEDVDTGGGHFRANQREVALRFHRREERGRAPDPIRGEGPDGHVAPHVILSTISPDNDVTSPAPTVRQRSSGRSSSARYVSMSSRCGSQATRFHGRWSRTASTTSLPVTPGCGGFAGGVHVHDGDHVRVVERLSEVLRQRGRARVAVGLEGAHDPAPPAGSGRLEQGLHLAGVVGVVVDEGHAPGPALVLEPAGDPGVPGQRRLAGVERRAQRHGGDRGRGRVAHVVEAGNREANVAENFVTPYKGERRPRPFADRVHDANVGIIARAVEHRSVRPAEPRRDRVVGTHDVRPRRLQEAVEGLLDGAQRSVVVEVIGFDVRDDRQVGGQLDEGAVALVGLDDEQLAVVPDRTAADLVELAPDDERRLESGLHEREREHRRGRGLAVRTGHGDAPARRRDRRQDLGSAHHRTPRSLAATTSGFRSGMAVDTATRSASPM